MDAPERGCGGGSWEEVDFVVNQKAPIFILEQMQVFKFGIFRASPSQYLIGGNGHRFDFFTRTCVGTHLF